MAGYRAFACSVVLAGCGPALVEDTKGAGGSETDSGDIARTAIYGEAESTELGVRVPTCIPVEGGCLRLSVVINMPDRITNSEAPGELVGPDCTPGSAPATNIGTFHGNAFTGHGTLWVQGDAVLADGSTLKLDVEALQGDCE